MNELMGSQLCPLPEHILKSKWAGDFSGALRAIDARLRREPLGMLRDRLALEREILQRLARQYPFSRGQAIAQIQAHVPDFTEAEFDRLVDEGGIDFLYVNGERRYFESAYEMLLDWDRGFLARSGRTPTAARPELDEAIGIIEREGSLGCRIRMRVALTIDDGAFVPGQTYRVHLSVPAACAQQTGIQIFADPDGYISAPRAPQRTVFYQRTLRENRPFAVEYEYDQRVSDWRQAEGEAYPGEPAPGEDDLSEIAPHLVFTPYLRELAARVRGRETEPQAIARACYDHVTQNVTYSYLRDYLLVDNVAEYVAVNGKGDCGAQVLLMMALLRINGIPCRWQSGTNAGAFSTGSHDWMQIYLAPHGWVLCDPSRGGGAYQAGATRRWEFFFGNMDPYRMVANRQYMAGFDPPKAFLRNDPYDNQSGECETGEGPLGPGQIHTERTLIKLERL